MTNDEKAKAYDMALEAARKELGVDRKEWKVVQQVLHNIFPALRESEDERIRKEIISALKFANDGGVYDKHIAYLEKQKINTEGDFGRGYDCGYQAGYAVAMNEMKPKVATATLATLDSEKQKEIPMPNSTELIEMWHKEEAMLREKDFRGDEWRLAYNAFLDGFAQGMMVKQKEPENTSASMMIPSCWEVEQKSQKPADDTAFEKWLDDWYQGSKRISGYVVMSEKEFKNWSRGIKNMYQQKLDIALIQRSWYMEGYHDREFGMEPRWIIKTEEGGPKHELNPKYGQLLDDEQKPAEEQDYSGLTNLERAIHRGFLSAGIENVPVTIIKETAKDCLAHMKPAEWSEEDKNKIDVIIRLVEQNSGWPDRAIKEYVNWLKSLRPQPKREVTDEEIEEMVTKRARSSGTTKSEIGFYRNGVKEAIKRFGLRSSWKPSEEQMEALNKARRFIPYNCDILESLYEQLKKL